MTWNRPNPAFEKLWRRGIAFRLSVLVTLILLPLAALLGYIYRERYHTRIDTALQTETEAAQGLSVSFAAYLNGIHKQNLSVGHAIRILSREGDERVIELLMTTVGQSVSVLSISWLSREGVVLASSSPGKEGLDLSGSPTFRALTAGHDLAFGDLEVRGPISRQSVIPLATAIRDFRGKLEGAVVAEIAPSSLALVVRAQRRLFDASLSLFDSRGTLVYHSGTGHRAGFWRQHDPMVARALATKTPQAGTRTAAAGDPHLYLSAVAPIPGAAWAAAASSAEEIAFAEVRRGMIVDTLLGGAVFALAFLLAYLLGRNISAPLRRLENDARLIGAGERIRLTDPFAPAEVASLRRTIISMAADLTMRAEQLRDSEELMRTVFENVYDGIAIHDTAGHFIEVNRPWLNMFRLEVDGIRGLTVSDISAAPPPLEELVQLWDGVLAGETTFFEWRARRPGDGSVFDVEVFLCPIRYRGRYVIMACVRDITERKRVAAELKRYRDELEERVRERTEELARAVEEIQRETAQRVAAVEELRGKEQLLIQQSRLAALGEMMGNIAHQWRQPLNLLGLIVQELKLSYQKGQFTEQQLMGSVSKAMTVISHMSQTIDDFRNLLTPDRVRVSFKAKEVVEKVLSLLQLQVEVRVEAEDEGAMEGSRNEFSQVLINIIGNARDAFRERQVRNPVIEIRIFRESGRSVVTIADNGGGIAEEILDKIFDPYFTTKGPDKGTGLGLFMSKTIIEKSMSGTLTVRNTPQGAEFRIEV